MATRSIQHQTRPPASQGHVCERIVAHSTHNRWLNAPAKSHDVVRHHSAPEWLRRALYLIIPVRVVAVMAGVWIFFPATAVSVLPPESLLYGKQAPPAVSSTDRGPLTIREALVEIAGGKLNPTPLSVTSDDMHGLWGGLTLTIRGNGNVEQKAVKEKAGTPTVVSPDSILKLVRLLLKQKAWEQRELQRAPKPDESTARLVIQYGKQRSEIWEWYNDLDKNQRLGKVRDLMKTIASK
jgi:hypothetical protein